MRGKANQAEAKNDYYTYRAEDRFKSEPRLNVNDLLNRAKEQRKIDKKFNVLIFSGALIVLLAVILVSQI